MMKIQELAEELKGQPAFEAAVQADIACTEVRHATRAAMRLLRHHPKYGAQDHRLGHAVSYASARHSCEHPTQMMMMLSVSSCDGCPMREVESEFCNHPLAGPMQISDFNSCPMRSAPVTIGLKR